MVTGERRIPPAVPLFAALIFGGSLALWPGAAGEAEGVQAAASPELEASEAQPRRNTLSASLSDKVQGAIRAAKAAAAELGQGPNDSKVSVLVKELGVEGALVDLDADRSMRPASNMKLATTAAALALLGGESSFETTFWSSAPIKGDVLSGDLVVRAGGDPLYRHELKGAVAPLLEPVVGELIAAGVARIDGDLVLDLGSFSEAQPAPGWPSPSQHWKDYCALSSGFSANAGCVSVSVRPGAVSQPAAVEVFPRGHGASLEFDVETVGKGKQLDLRVVVRPDLIKVWGEIPIDVREFFERYAHPDPVGLFASALRHALSAGGVELGGAVRLERGAVGERLLARLQTPVMSALAPINRDSNNSVADQLFLKLGADASGSGDREGAAFAASAFFESLGVSPEGYAQIDGSGLSKNNRITPRQLVSLLDAAVRRPGPSADAFMESLALAGQTGTLDDRMRGGVADSMVRAKTGFINGTSALSGIALTQDERFLVFSILVEYKARAGLNRSVWKPMQDRICEAIVRGA